jgi:hypothetical protein
VYHSLLVVLVRLFNRSELLLDMYVSTVPVCFWGLGGVRLSSLGVYYTCIRLPFSPWYGPSVDCLCLSVQHTPVGQLGLRSWLGHIRGPLTHSRGNHAIKYSIAHTSFVKLFIAFLNRSRQDLSIHNLKSKIDRFYEKLQTIFTFGLIGGQNGPT